MTLTAIIMAAGQGTRMRSKLPKVMHPLMGRPMVAYTLETVNNLRFARPADDQPVVIVGYGADEIRQYAGNTARFVVQQTQLGTGHAVQQAEELLRGQVDEILVLAADMPLLQAGTLTKLVEIHKTHAGPITLLTVKSQDPRGFGRIIRDSHGDIQAIVEQAQATPEQLAITELNAGVYCFSADWLWEALRRIPMSPKGEYYLTDVVGIAVSQGLSVRSYTTDDADEAIGINTRVHLAEAERILRDRINSRWMLAGVTIVDPQSTYIEPGVEIGQDTVIWPNSYLQGVTVVGEDCVIGPNTLLRDSHVGDRCRLLTSVLEEAFLEADVSVGPFAHLRKGAHLARGVHMGNYGEVKNSYLGPGTKMGHFSYIGDATIEADVNIGAGTITCNFDGLNKYPTKIGAGAFIGSDTMLVAPVKVGEGARTGAGSVVTKDVPDHTLAVGVPARAIRKLKDRD
jgi:bifunctional UDP-N-acetylglucosamine pyrophosphorylase/glucosamine-1-phosphate N-acetyltransferase